MITNNEIYIKPVTTWTKGEIKTLTILRVENYFDYDFSQKPGVVQYSLFSISQSAEGVDIYERVVNDVLPLTWDLVNAWGADDTPIFDYVLQTLGLQRL